MTLICFLLHLIEQNCLVKTFLRTLISMTQVTLQKVIANLDSPEGSGPDCNLVIALLAKVAILAILEY